MGLVKTRSNALINRFIENFEHASRLSVEIPTTTAVTTVSVKKTQYIHTETTNTKHDKIYPLHTRLSQRVKYSVSLYTQFNYYGITKH